MRKVARSGFALVLASALWAQDAAVGDLMPRDAVVLAQMQGPSALGKHFAKTKLATVFTDPALREAWNESLAKWRELFVDELEAVDETVFELLDVHAAFPGRITFGLGLRLEQAKPSAIWSLVFDGADEAGLEKVRQAIAAMVEGEADPAIGLGEKRVPVALLGGGQSWIAEPVRAGARVALFGGFGQKVPSALDDLLCGTKAPPLALVSAPLSLHLDGSRLADLLERALLEGVRGPNALPPKAAKAMLRAVGLRAVKSCDFVATAVGDRLQAEAVVQIDREQPQGMFRFWSSISQIAADPDSKMLRLVPERHPLWTVSRIDLSLFPGFVKEVWATLGDAVPLSYAEGIEKAKEFLKVDPEQDLFAHLGDEVLVLQNLVDDLPEALETGNAAKDMRQAQNYGNCFVLRLRDGAAFGKAVERAVRARGLHVGRKSEEVAGAKVFRLDFFGAVVVTYAVTEEHFFVALGDEAGKDLVAALTRARTLAADAPVTVVSEELRKEIARMPGIVGGFGVNRVTDLCDTIAAQMDALAADEDPEVAKQVAGMFRVFVELPKAIRRANLPPALSLASSTKDRLVWRWLQ